MRSLPLSLLLAAMALVPGRMQAVTFSGLGDVPGGNFSSLAQAISSDGTTVVGQGTGGANTSFIWTAAGGPRALYTPTRTASPTKRARTARSSSGATTASAHALTVTRSAAR